MKRKDSVKSQASDPAKRKPSEPVKSQASEPMKSQASEPAESLWIISRSLASKHDLKRGGAGLMYHVQARTADQLCSFATLCSERAPMTRQKAADGVTDVFTCMSDQGHATMNVFGRIRYEGTWPS